MLVIVDAIKHRRIVVNETSNVCRLANSGASTAGHHRVNKVVANPNKHSACRGASTGAGLVLVTSPSHAAYAGTLARGLFWGRWP